MTDLIVIHTVDKVDRRSVARAVDRGKRVVRRAGGSDCGIADAAVLARADRRYTGVSVSNCVKLRPFSGRSFTALSPITVPSCAVELSTSVPAASTLMDCDTLPTLIAALIVTACATATLNAAMFSVWKFGVANVSGYRAGGTLEKKGPGKIARTV